jgi:putative CocE/NonD family hydrolase
VLARLRTRPSVPLPGGGNADQIFALEDATPLDQSLLSDNCPWYRDWTMNSDENDYWNQPGLNHAAYADRLPPIPMAFIGGWYDQFLGGTILDYQNAPGDVSLTIGPWVHGQMDKSTAGEGAFGPSASVDKRGEALRWFDRYLKGADVPRPEPVRYFLMGGGGSGSTQMGGAWQAAPSWPPPEVEYVPYYFHANGSLSPDLPQREPPDAYAYDPRDPVPTIGGNISSGSIFAPAGAFVQQCRAEWPACRGSTDELAARPDIVTYQTEPLEEDLAVVGPLTVELWAATSAADTDFTAKLVDVSPNGDAVNVADGIIRARYNDDRTEPHFVPPGSVKNYSIDLWHTAMLFKAGHSIRVDISSSNFPHFDRNLNTGNPIGSDVLDNAVVATQTIFHDGVRPSHILLPVLPPQ